MYCSKCGSYNENEANFCLKCGNLLHVEQVNNQFDNQLFWHGISVCGFFEYPGTMVYSFHLFFRPNFLKYFFFFTPFSLLGF